MGDSKRDLLAKYLTAIGGTPIPGDTFYDLLVKVVRTRGGVPVPGDKQWDLLVKWLKLYGECRKCGDSLHVLWRKILAIEEACGLQPTFIVAVQVSPGGPFNVDILPKPSGVIFEVFRSLNGGPWTSCGIEDGLNFPFEGCDVGVVNGDAVRFAVRRQGTDEACQIVSDTIIASGF